MRWAWKGPRVEGTEPKPKEEDAGPDPQAAANQRLDGPSCRHPFPAIPSAILSATATIVRVGL